MGSIAAHKVRTVVENVSWVIAAEMLAAGRALGFVSHKAGRGTETARRLIEERVPFQDGDQILYEELNQVYDLLRSGLIAEEVEKAVGGRLC